MFLLNTSTNKPGGLGLTAKYYSSSTLGGLDDIVRVDTDAGSGLGDVMVNTFEKPYYTRIEQTVSASWPDGYVIPIIEDSSTTISDSDETRKKFLSMRFPNASDYVIGVMSAGYGKSSIGGNTDIGSLRQIGQSIIWDGYLVPPRDDVYSFLLVMKRMSGSIYIDDELVYDNIESISNPMTFISNSAYHIRIEGVVINHENWNAPVSIELQWKTPVVKWSRIPAFYLYDSADVINFSPFPVNVGGMKTDVHYPGQNTY